MSKKLGKLGKIGGNRGEAVEYQGNFGGNLETAAYVKQALVGPHTEKYCLILLSHWGGLTPIKVARLINYAHQIQLLPFCLIF